MSIHPRSTEHRSTHPRRRSILLAAVAISVVLLYLFKLNGVGVLGPDEPRYAAIGRAMASSGDLVTPVLWGKPWFEKPPLLYWMTAFGTAAGLGPDLCGRLPIAILSLLFLAGTFLVITREFGLNTGAIATAALATSAGWLTYSSLCLTDLPLAVTFSLAVFVACSLVREQPAGHVEMRFILIGLLLGLGMLAKGLVPIVLAIPFLWFLRGYFRLWWLTIVASLAVALPWYGMVYARNGYAFIDDFFIKHHFQRLYSAALEHTQPWYYYVPVLLVGLFPWTPLFGLLFFDWNERDRNKHDRNKWDRRHQLLLAVAAFGFVFFSITRNKLPHYLLPILPCLFVLLASHLQKRRLTDIPRGWLLACALLIATIPVAADALPQMLAVGRLSKAALAIPGFAGGFFIALPIAVVFLTSRFWTAPALAMCFIGGMVYLKVVAYPVIDKTVSPRAFWLANAARLRQVCNGGTNRDWLYGISYYREADFPECQTGHFQFVLRTVRRGAPELFPLP